MPNTISLGCQWGNAFTTFFKEINVILNIVHFERKIEKDRNRGRKIKRERGTGRRREERRKVGIREKE